MSESFDFTLSVGEAGVRIWNRPLRTDSTFDPITGAKISGTLDLPAETVLFMAWRQRQSPRLNERQLRAMWRSRA